MDIPHRYSVVKAKSKTSYIHRHKGQSISFKISRRHGYPSWECPVLTVHIKPSLKIARFAGWPGVRVPRARLAAFRSCIGRLPQTKKQFPSRGNLELGARAAGLGDQSLAVAWRILIGMPAMPLYSPAPVMNTTCKPLENGIHPCATDGATNTVPVTVFAAIRVQARLPTAISPASRVHGGRRFELSKTSRAPTTLGAWSLIGHKLLRYNMEDLANPVP